MSKHTKVGLIRGHALFLHFAMIEACDYMATIRVN